MNPNTTPVAVSPEELRQQVVDTLWEEMGGTNFGGAEGHDSAADAILGLSAIRRALARDAAIEAATPLNEQKAEGPVSAGFVGGYNALLERLRAVGTE